MQSTLQPGMTLCGKYKILQKIGKGGMAFVFKAYSLVHNKECALKEMQDQYLDPESKDKITAQFMNEAVTLSKLNHPGVPYVLETFEAEGKHYLAMEYVAGDTLEDFVVNSPTLLTQNQVLGIVWQITDILKYLHNLPEPVILRDLKPSNIMLNKDGKIKIIDFGIAKVFEQGNASRTMAKIKGSGSSGFAPPEQYGAGGTDKRSDIYAFGVTIYYLLTGQILPDSVDRILSGGRLDPVKDANPTAGNAIQIMIEKMVQLKPADRFQNVEEVIEYLKQNGMSGDFPLLKPTISPYQEEIKPEYEFPDFPSNEEEEEEDSNIYLPRQVYNKRRNTQTVQNDNKEEEEYQRKSEIKSRFDSSSVPLQTEKLLGSNGIADGVKSDGSLRRNIEEIAAQDTTRRLNQSDIPQFLAQKNPELANKLSASKKEEVQPEKEKKPTNWGCLVWTIVILTALGFGGYHLYNWAKAYVFPTQEKQQKLKQENNTAQVESKKTEEKPVITYVEQSSSGKISQIERANNSSILILKSLVDGKYVKLKQGEEPLPEGLKVGAEVSVLYKIPKTNPQQPYEIIKIKLTNPTPKTQSNQKAKSSSSSSSNYSSGSSSYTPPSQYSNYSSGSSSYAPPSRQSNYSSGSSNYTPPSRSSSSSSSTSSSYTPPSSSSSSSSSTSESGGFTQKRSTDY